MEDIYGMFIKYHNFLVFRSSLKEKVPVDTSYTTVNRGILRILPNIQDKISHKNSWQLLAVKYFGKTLHLRCLTGFWICLCVKKQLVRSVFQKDILSAVRILTDTCNREPSYVILDQWTALYQERPPQMGLNFFHLYFKF